MGTHENMHLDCSYFLLRREPDVLIRLLFSGPHNNNNNDDGGGGSDGGGNHKDDNDVDDDEDEDGDGVGSDGDGDDDIGNSKNNDRGGTKKTKERRSMICSIIDDDYDDGKKR